MYICYVLFVAFLLLIKVDSIIDRKVYGSHFLVLHINPCNVFQKHKNYMLNKLSAGQTNNAKCRK